MPRDTAPVTVRRVGLGVVLAALLTASTLMGPSAVSTARAQSAPVRSIVQLGDSIAAGEGTLYGYTYDRRAREWTGGNLDVTWPGPYPECHDSPDAYGNQVAASLHATFTQFACTGATFDNGIAAEEVFDGTEYRPAQFGNWANQTQLNAAYDAANPDVVLVTLGADDLQFHDVIEECVKNSYARYFHLADLACVAQNPGSTVQEDVLEALPALQVHYATLASWITQRAQANSRPVPKVVFTSYPNPLPAQHVKCPDTNLLYAAQVRYLSSLVAKVNQTIRSSIQGLGLPNVALADLSDAYQPEGQNHQWCSRDPWAYGLSIIHFTDPSSFDSQAPFHATPRGQERIAQLVTPVVQRLTGS